MRPIRTEIELPTCDGFQPRVEFGTLRVVTRLSILMTAAVLVTLSSTLAAADERVEEASGWFRQGEAAFRRGDARAAADAFEQAHRLVPHGATVYNAGLAWAAAGEKARAAQAFGEAIERGGLSDSQARDARKRLRELRSTLGMLRISGPAGASVDVAHVQGATAPVAVFLEPGTHRIEVSLADGQRLSRMHEVALGDDEVVIRSPTEVSAISVEPSSSRRTFGWVALGGAAVLSGAGVYLGLEALEARDQFNDSGQTDADAHDRAASMRLWTNVAWAAAGASAITGIVLLSGAESDEGDGDTSQLRVGTQGLVWSGTW